MAHGDKDLLVLASVGDVSPQRDDPPAIFRHSRDALRSADVVFGQLEANMSDRGTPMFVNSGALARLATKNVSALTADGAGFDVMSFASNHAMDYGWDAFYDTLDLLKKNGVALVGAGRNIAEARKPVIVERNGTKIGFLAYLTIAYLGFTAEEEIPGCAPLRSTHFYKQEDPQPGTPPLIITTLYPEDRSAMEEDIRKLRSQVDVLVVYDHGGLHFIPATIAMYQREVGYAAIDAGADLVLQSHAHILKGVEIYKGKGIFYGLGNFAVEHTLAVGGKKKLWTTQATGLKSRFYGIEREPGWEKYFYAPDSRKTMIAKAYIQDGQIVKLTYVPACINQNCEPEVVTRQDPRAQEVFDYVKQISATEKLKVRFAWEGDEVLIS